jgi:hypothetical protein
MCLSSTSKDSSDGAMEVAGGHLEEFDLFDPYEAAPERAHDLLLQRLLRAVNKGVAAQLQRLYGH